MFSHFWLEDFKWLIHRKENTAFLDNKALKIFELHKEITCLNDRVEIASSTEVEIDYGAHINVFNIYS